MDALKTTRRFTSEVDLAKSVIAWLIDQRWDVYQEVQLHYGGQRADIVAVQNQRTWVIETKQTMSLDLIGQALRWQYDAHWVSMASPRAFRKNASRAVVDFFCRHSGVGWLLVGVDNSVTENYHPRLNRRTPGRLLAALSDGHKTFAEAGNAAGRRWSPFQETCSRIQRVVTSHPGISLKELIAAVDHHYASTVTAKSCISKWVQRGVVKGVESRIEGRRLALYPATQEPQ